jgi:hypothetical protein
MLQSTIEFQPLPWESSVGVKLLVVIPLPPPPPQQQQQQQLLLWRASMKMKRRSGRRTLTPSWR